ncbi:MAG TPA: ATP-dependent Clp protease adaptor ClpS [Thermoanaerobaculia bacterium]|nr:ATP-dependent Clp protease adaptor ClpS [Thermoanaerobaculia bacterium]
MTERRSHDAQQNGEVLLERRIATRRPRMYRVLLHNDDYTTMEFVVAVLVSCFQRSRTDAVRIMLEVHHLGVGVAGVFPREVAETKVAEATAAAQNAGMPLLVTAEPEEDDPDGGKDEPA